MVDLATRFHLAVLAVLVLSTAWFLSYLVVLLLEGRWTAWVLLYPVTFLAFLTSGICCVNTLVKTMPSELRPVQKLLHTPEYSDV